MTLSYQFYNNDALMVYKGMRGMALMSTSRYLDDLLNIDNPYFEQMVGQIYPTEL